MLRSAIIAALVATVSAQCTSEVLAIAGAGQANEQSCALLAAFELCVSRVPDDAARGNLEAALVQQQQQYAECGDSGSPLTASVRTEEDALQFTGRDFTFHRTTRQSLNLYGLRDTVSRHGDAISTLNASTADEDIASLRAALVGLSQNQTLLVASLRAALVGLSQNQTLQAAQLAAIANQEAPCIPYVEFTNATGACLPLNRTCDTFGVPHYESARPTRTSDRQCTPKTPCTSAQYQTVRGSDYEDATCAAVTNCSRTGQVTLTPATATADAVCIRRVGLTRDTALEQGCKELLNVTGFDTPSGFYWVNFAGTRLQVYCDMEHEGGGWTMVGRGKGGAATCWGNNEDCNIGALGPGQNRYEGVTGKLSDGKINSISYTRIRFSGHNMVRGNQYWIGKDDRSSPGYPGCTYRHRTISNGRCNCASLRVDMADMRCGRPHPSHRGVGDWPANGALYSYHASTINWYFKSQARYTTYGRDYCHGGSSRCNVALWIR